MAANWRQFYNEWEKAVAPSLEQITASDGFRDVMSVAAQVSRSVMGETEKLSRQWLHLWNLPAAGDVRSLRRQIAGLDREVQSLRRILEESEAAGSVATLSVVADADADIAADLARAEGQ